MISHRICVLETAERFQGGRPCPKVWAPAEPIQTGCCDEGSHLPPSIHWLSKPQSIDHRRPVPWLFKCATKSLWSIDSRINLQPGRGTWDWRR